MKVIPVLFLGLFILGCSCDLKGQGKGDVTRDDQGRITGFSGTGDSSGKVTKEVE